MFYKLLIYDEGNSSHIKINLTEPCYTLQIITCTLVASVIYLIFSSLFSFQLPIVFQVDDALETKLVRKFQLVVDKGTLDAIGLHPDGAIKRCHMVERLHSFLLFFFLFTLVAPKIQIG